jgi:hypothetical protein
MSRPREISKLFSTNTSITTDSELASINLSNAINTASAAAYSAAVTAANIYTDNAAPDLNPAIQAASAAAVNYLINGAPETLDTLNELAQALENNADILDIYLTKSSASTIYATKIEVSTIDVDNLPDIYINMGG